MLLFIYKARLIFAIAFNVLFIPLAYLVIKHYERDEFSKRYMDDSLSFKYEEYISLIDFSVHFQRHVVH